MCQFTINYPGEKESIIQKLQNAIIATNGRFNGDTSNGIFEGNTPVGSFSGSYTIQGDSINVNVDKKPWLIGCSRIEEEINKYINSDLA